MKKKKWTCIPPNRTTKYSESLVSLLEIFYPLTLDFNDVQKPQKNWYICTMYTQCGHSVIPDWITIDVNGSQIVMVDDNLFDWMTMDGQKITTVFDKFVDLWFYPGHKDAHFQAMLHF